MIKPPPSRRAKRPPSGAIPPEDFAAAAAILRERREKALADRLETQNQVTMGILIPRQTCTHYLGQIGAVYPSILYSVSGAEGGLIQSYLKTQDMQIMADVRRIVDHFCYDAVRRMKKDMDEWLRRYKE